MKTNKRHNLLEIIVNTRTVKALDRAVEKSRAYQNTLKRQDIAFEALQKAGLNKEQNIIVDRAITATNDCGAVYGAVAYRLGLHDGIRLMTEIERLS